MWGGVCDPLSQQGLGEVPPPAQGLPRPRGAGCQSAGTSWASVCRRGRLALCSLALALVGVAGPRVSGAHAEVRQVRGRRSGRRVLQEEGSCVRGWRAGCAGVVLYPWGNGRVLAGGDEMATVVRAEAALPGGRSQFRCRTPTASAASLGVARLDGMQPRGKGRWPVSSAPRAQTGTGGQWSVT